MGIIGEIFKVLLEGPYTEKYPKVKSPAASGYRGRLVFDSGKCMGCGACASVCPSAAITVLDEGRVRIVKVNLGKCIFCGKCQENCPYEAVRLTEDYELGALKLEELESRIELELRLCSVCGSPIAPEKLLASIEEKIVELGLEDLVEALKLCPACRAKRQSHIVSTKLPLKLNLK